MIDYDETELDKIIQFLFNKFDYADVYENGICIRRMMSKEETENLILKIFKIHIVCVTFEFLAYTMTFI